MHMNHLRLVRVPVLILALSSGLGPSLRLQARPVGGSSVSVSFGSGVGPCRTGFHSGFSRPTYCPPSYYSYPYCGSYYAPCYPRSFSTFYYGSYPTYPAPVISTAPPPPPAVYSVPYTAPRYSAPSYQTHPPYSSVPGRPVYDGQSVPSARPVQPRNQASASNQSDKIQEQTVQVQAALRKLGYYGGAVDGLMGPATQTAIRTFQIDHGLSVTGKIDEKLQKELEKEASGEEQR